MGYTRSEDQSVAGSRIGSIRRILWIILALNVAVAVAKLVWGLATHSAAMQADGFHSFFDGTSNIIGLVGMAAAGRPADRSHPYGHGKYETYASAAIAGMLVFAAYRIGSSAIAGLTGEAKPVTVDTVSFAIMIGTLAVNLFVTTWERRVGKKLGSAILVADASHTRSDILVSLGVIVSLVLVKAGLPAADPIVALLVAGAIIFTAWGVFKQASATLSDSMRIPPAEIVGVAREIEGVLGVHHVRSRGPEAEVYVDLHVQVAASLTVEQGHRIAESVERHICERFDNVADVIAHLEPLDDYQKAKTEADIDAGLA